MMTMSTARYAGCVICRFATPHTVQQDTDNNTILLLLADAKPSINSPYSSSQSEQEFLSATLRMARLYYDRYPDILDWANVEGRTALHVAALKGKEELVRVSIS